MVSIGFQLILSILIGLFCLFLSLIFYYVLRAQGNQNLAIGNNILVLNEGLRIYYTRTFKSLFILFIIIFTFLTFVPQYNIRFAFSLLLGSICAIVFSFYLIKSVYYVFLDIINKKKKDIHQFVLIKIIVIIGFFSLSLSIICCDILFFLFGDEENIKYIIGFMLGMGISFIAIRMNGILFKERMFYINENIESTTLILREEKRDYYYSAINIMNNIVDDLVNMCSGLFDNYMLILLGSILLASLITPAELELLSNVVFDMRNLLMFLPIALSTLTILVFMINVMFLFFFRSTKVNVLFQYFLFIVFFTLLSLSFILIFLYGLNIRVFFTYFLGLLMALTMNLIYGYSRIKKLQYDSINIFRDIFIMFSILATAVLLSMYIGGSYGLSMMSFGFASYNGIIISEIIICIIFYYCKKIFIQFDDSNEGKFSEIINIDYYKGNPYFVKPYNIFQTINMVLTLLIVYVTYNNIPLMNITLYYTLGGILLGGAILALQYLLVNFIAKKDILFFKSLGINNLQQSIGKNFNNILNNFFLMIIDNAVKNAIVRTLIPFLSLSAIITLLLLMTDFNIFIAVILGIIFCYLSVAIILITFNKILENSNVSLNLIKYKNYYSNFGWDVIKFLILIALIFRFGG